jgi:hypothetical protein
MKILLAVDGSPYTKRMLAYVAAHDEWLGAHHDYTIVTAIPAVTPRAQGLLRRGRGEDPQVGAHLFQAPATGAGAL